MARRHLFYFAHEKPLSFSGPASGIQTGTPPLAKAVDSDEKIRLHFSVINCSGIHNCSPRLS